MGENLKYEQINWGWLNDYSGYKFAPITFFENIYTSQGNTFEEIYSKNIFDLETGIFVVGSAKTLIEDKGTYLTPFTTNATTPVYFNEGMPVQCEKIEIDLTGNINKDNPTNTYIINGGTINGTTINGTTINGDTIEGTAINGTFRGDITFTNPITLNFSGDEMNDTTCTISGSNDSFNIDMSLKTTGVTAASYGPSADASLVHAGTFTVPYITVDSKGRLTAASTRTYTLPEGNKVSIAKASNTTKRYILTNSATGDEATNNQLMYYDSIYVDYNGTDVASAVLMGAAWNDYAEYRNQVEEIEPGYCVASTNQGKVYKTTEKFQACDGIVSDTYGFTIGKTDECQTPLAVSGRVLAYYNGNRKDYNAGDTVCAGPNGKICKMTREEIKEYPDRIVGIVSEIPEYEEWNGKKVDNRIWIKVK